MSASGRPPHKRSLERNHLPPNSDLLYHKLRSTPRANTIRSGSIRGLLSAYFDLVPLALGNLDEITNYVSARQPASPAIFKVSSCSGLIQSGKAPEALPTSKTYSLNRCECHATGLSNQIEEMHRAKIRFYGVLGTHGRSCQSRTQNAAMLLITSFL